MGRTFLLTAALTVALLAAPATAQTAFRCDGNGKTVYSDTPCPPGNTAKAIAPTQETPAQKAAAQAASTQARQDNAYIDKRLDERYKRETARPAVVESTTVTVKKRTKRKASKTVFGADTEPKRGGIVKSKKATKAKRATTKAGPKKNNKSYRPTPKP